MEAAKDTAKSFLLLLITLILTVHTSAFARWGEILFIVRLRIESDLTHKLSACSILTFRKKNVDL